MKNKNQKIQDKAIDEVHATLAKAGIEAVLIVDEDVIDRLDGDTRISKLSQDKIDRIKKEAIDGLMDYWSECLDCAIENIL